MMYGILILIGIIIAIYFIFKCINGFNAKQENIQYSQGIVMQSEVKYLGGFSEIEGSKTSIIIIYKDKIKLSIMRDKMHSFDKTLYLTNIENITIKSETQIKSEINLGKLLVFGFFALAMKDDKTIVNNYLVIDYKENEQIQSIVLSTSMNENIVQLINGLKRRDL